MLTADQLKILIESFAAGDETRFYRTALRLAADEARRWSREALSERCGAGGRGFLELRRRRRLESGQDARAWEPDLRTTLIFAG